MFIYKITNSTNGKVYVGKWQGPNLAHRWQRHVSDAERGKGFFLHRAMRKNGIAAFSLSVLHETPDPLELCQAEIGFIFLYQSHTPQYGYNLTLGGDGIPINDATRQKMRKFGPANHFYGKKHSQETKARLSAAATGRTAHNKGRAMYPVSKEKLKRSWLAKLPVPPEELHKRYESGLSLYAIGRETGMAPQRVHNWLKKTNTTMRARNYVR